MNADELIEEIDEWRQMRHISKFSIAKKCGKSYRTTRRFFNHENIFSDIEWFEKIANAVGLELYLIPITRRKK